MARNNALFNIASKMISHSRDRSGFGPYLYSNIMTEFMRPLVLQKLKFKVIKLKVIKFKVYVKYHKV